MRESREAVGPDGTHTRNRQQLLQQLIATWPDPVACARWDSCAHGIKSGECCHGLRTSSDQGDGLSAAAQTLFLTATTLQCGQG